jgi:radical SAM family protein
MALNACELEIDLFCRGLRMPGDVTVDDARPISRTRAGLGSGLEVVIPTGSRLKPKIWVNVPVAEVFAHSSPYRLAGDSHVGYRIVDDRDGIAYPIVLPPEPAWYSRLTSSEQVMSRIGVLQGTYLGIYVNPVCAFWQARPQLNCRFCTTGRNVGGPGEAHVKSIEDVIETCWAAKQESGITFVHLNGGYGAQGLEFIRPYVQAIKQRVGLLVGVQLAPEHDFTRYDALVDAGVDHLSICLELLDPRWFAYVCPGKARVHGQSLYFSALRYCAAVMPPGAVSGEVIAGLEPTDYTLEAIDRITDVGAFPTVCVFRPTVGSDLESWPAPSYMEMRRVMTHLYEACRRHWLPIGAAPNIEVSLVVNPDDAAMLAERNVKFYAYEVYRRLMRLASGPIFHRRMRAA